MTTIRRILVTAALFLFCAGAAHADIITIRSDYWCPYNCKPDSKKPGYGIEIAKEIFEKAGHTVDYQLMNWTRSIERGRAGDHVAIIGARKEEADGYVFPAEPIGRQGNKFAVPKESDFVFSGMGSLGGKLLGVIQSYSYNEGLDDYIKKNAGNAQAVDIATGDDALEKNIAKLAAGRLDAVVDDSAVLTYKINEMGLSDKMKLVSDGAEPTAIYVTFSPKNPKAKDYAALWDKGMAELRASGRLTQILDRYGLSDWK